MSVSEGLKKQAKPLHELQAMTRTHSHQFGLWVRLDAALESLKQKEREVQKLEGRLNAMKRGFDLLEKRIEGIPSKEFDRKCVLFYFNKFREGLASDKSAEKEGKKQ